MDTLASFEAAFLAASSLQSIEDAPTTSEFAARLLHALTAMAHCSRRREAEVQAAMHRAGLSADPALLAGALRLLEAHGCLKNVVPLSDGGTLLIVTGADMDRTEVAPAGRESIPAAIANGTMLAGASAMRARALEPA
jgi:hypothetical protein